MNYNLLNNIIDGITAPVRFISFITSNWLGLAIGLTLSLLVILVIWIISKQMPNKIICLLLVLIFSIGGLFVFSKLKPTGDSDVHIPTNEEQSEQLDLSVKENWTNTNGGFTINQINNVQKDDEAPRLDDQIITLNVQDYGPYVCFWYEDNSGVYQNAVFLKTEKGLIYDGMLMTTCKYKDKDWNRVVSILTIWGAAVREYVIDSLTWNINKTQIPYYYNYNLATISSGSSCKFCTNNLDGSSWNHTNTPEARARIMQEMTSSTGIIATNIGGYFIKFNDVEIIGTKENATKSINTFYNYLYEQIKGIGTSGFKNIDVTSLTCVPIPNELQSNYPISADKEAEYDGAEYYGVYRVNNYVNLSLTQGNKMIDKSKNVDSYIDDNDDSERLDVDKVDINSADYTNVAIDLNCIDGDISNVDLSNNPVVIKFYCKDLNITKTISYTTKNKLNSINKIMLVSNYRWDYEIISNALVFESNKGYFEPIKTSANLIILIMIII